jgi:putative two-component system hydrogenase maturation factor HypX/HoxX
MRQSDRAIDWSRDSTKEIAAKISAADSTPGVLDTLLGRTCFLYGAHVEDRLKGPTGEIIAQRDGAICIGTIDGAVWISHLGAKGQGAPQEAECRVVYANVDCGPCNSTLCSLPGIKLPATQVLGSLLRGVPEAPLAIDAPTDHHTFREIVYEEEGDVGYLSFDFYNGAMSTAQCYRLRDAFLLARSRPTKVIVLLGGADFWSNGIHLNVIEASNDPAKESWRNINAIDDLSSRFSIPCRISSSPDCAAMLELVARCWRWRRITSFRPPESSSTRITEAWASSMDQNIGPTCCRRESGKRGRWS